MRKLNLERSTEKPSATPIPTAPMTYTAAPIAVGSSSAADSCTTAAVPHATTEFSASADAHSAVFPAPTPASPFTLAAHIRTTAPAFAAASAIHCTPTNTSTPPWRAVQARTSTPFPGAPTSGLFSPTTEQASTAGHPCFGSFGSATEHAAPPDTSSSAFNSWNPSLFPLKAFAFAVNPFQQRHTGFPNYAGTPAGQFLKTENSFQCDAEQKEVESAAIHRDFPAEKPDTSSSATAGNLAKASTVVPFAPLAPSAPSPSNRSFRSGLHIVHTPPTLTEPAAPPTDTAPVPVVGTIAQGSDDQQDSAEEALTPPPQSPTACMPVSPVSDPINAPDPSQAAECEAQSQLESARDQQAACTTSIAAEPAHTDCTVRLSPQQLKQLHERAPDWVFDPLLDTRDPQFKPGSVRDEDWAEHDALLAQSCGHENSYGTSLVLPILLQTTGTVDPATPSDALGKAGTAAKIILKSTAAAVSEKKGVLNTKKVRFGAVATHIFDDDTGAHATGLCNNRNDVFPAALQPPFIADITHSNYFDEESKEKSTMAPVIPQETSISPVPRVTNENITNFSGTFTTRTAADAPAFTPAWLTPKPWVPSLACAQPHTSIGLPVGMDSVVKQPQSPHWQALTPVTHGFGGGNDWLTFRYSAMLKSSTPHISPHNKFSAANFAVGNSDEAQYASNSADANSCLTTADSDVRATQQWIAIPPLNSSGNLGAFPYARIPSEPAVKPSAPSSETLTLKVDSLHDGGSPNGGGMPHTNGEFTAAAQQTPVLQPATVQDSGVYDALQNKTAAEDKGSKTMIDATASTTSASSDCYSAGGGSFVA